jgi:copper homeostasis protein CutC
VRLTLEIAVATPDEAVAAVETGADRLELSAGFELGGLTPSFGVFSRVRELVAAPIWVLLRPRPGGFVYTADEVESVLCDARTFLSAGADGLVFGALDENGRVAADPCRRLSVLAGGRVAFHRAFDFSADPHEALEQLVSLRFQRILTSGGKKTAREGAPAIADLIERAMGRIEIMPGGDIRCGNVALLVRDTGCRELHASARGSKHDACLAFRPHLAAAMGGANCAVTTTDPELVAGLRKELDRLSSLT